MPSKMGSSFHDPYFNLKIYLLFSYSFCLFIENFSYQPFVEATSYDFEKPFRTINEDVTYQIDNYTVDVKCFGSGDLHISIIIVYHVFQGVKRYGFKQLLMPNGKAFITSVTVEDDYGEIYHHIVKDHKYVEIGWKFFHAYTR